MLDEHTFDSMQRTGTALSTGTLAPCSSTVRFGSRSRTGTYGFSTDSFVNWRQLATR